MVNETECREALERLRWSEGPVCPHCGSEGPVALLQGSSHRDGLYTCSECRKQFTVTVGTPLEGSKLPLSTWLKAAHMLNALSKTVTVREVEQALGVTYKTAWHMVQKLLSAVENYRGPLRQSGVPVFGATVCARVEPLLPKTRNTVTYWKARETRKRKGTYRAPRVPIAAGALSGSLFDPPATKAHTERTERFLCWVLEG